MKKKSEVASKKTANKRSESPRTRKRSRSGKFVRALPIVGLIALIIALAAALVFVIARLSTTQMIEIDTDSDLIAVPMGRYFYDTEGGCSSYEDILLADGKKSADSYSDELKERIVINFLINQKHNGYPYSYINEIYQAFFGKDKSIAEKDVYETADGKITRNEYGTYVSEGTCTAPEIYTCVVLDKAYKSEKNDTLKVVAGVFTVTSEDNNIYAGLVHEGEALGVRTDFDVTARMTDLPKWELVFKIDKTTGLYQLAYTNKLA